MTSRRNFLTLAGATTLGLQWPSQAFAQEFPSRPIHFVVPLQAGGSADLLSRLVGQHLTKRWGQPVVIDMRPGGGTVIGTGQVARAAPDGYSVLFTANSLVINAKLRHDLPYDGLKAFEPIALMVTSPQVIAVAAESPLKTFRQFLDAAKAQPGTVSLASLGPDTTQHIAIEMLAHEAKAEFIYVPFSGGSQAVTAVLGNHVNAVLGNYAEVAPHVESGKLRALAVTTLERLPSLPQIPTVAESGFPKYEAVAWFGVSAPAGTPTDVIALWAQGIESAMQNPEIVQQLATFGLQPRYMGPGEFTTHIAQNYARYSQSIDAARIKAL